MRLLDIVFQTLGIIYFISLGFLWFSIVKLYLKIKAMEDNRQYSGFFYEHTRHFVHINSIDDFIDYFPLSRFLKKEDHEKNIRNEYILKLYELKYKYETYFWSIFFGGIISLWLLDILR